MEITEILIDVLVTAMIVFAVGFCARYFRILINDNALSGMDPGSARQLLKSQSFGKKLFMTYIWRCNTNGKKHMGLAVWFFICHCIHVMASLGLLIMLWYEILLDIRVVFEVFILGFRVTHGSLGNLFIALIVASLPASILLAVPFLWLKKKKG